MSLNVIDLIKGQLGPALVSQAASQFGESESGISKAISGLLPAVVGGLANNADKPAVLDAITGAASNGLLSNLLSGTQNNSLISTVLSAIFGDKIGELVNSISSFAGVSNTSSNSILNLVTGAALGALGKHSADSGLDRMGITKLLGDQKGIVSSLLPAGLSMATLGLGNMFGGNNTEKVRVSSFDEPKKVEVNRGGSTHVNVDNKDNNGGGSIWKWLLPLLLLLLAGYFLWNKCSKKDAAGTTGTTDSTAVVSDSSNVVGNAVDSTVAAVKEITDIDVNGKKIKGYANGFEYNMVNFLKSDGYKNAADDAALKDTWYSFDNVNFVFGKADQITPESKGQLENLAAILKAYPESKIKIGGYTDKKGDDKQNLELSQKRADFIKAELGKLGVGAQVISAEGYGEQFATVAETASDKEREADRKMAVRFAK